MAVIVRLRDSEADVNMHFASLHRGDCSEPMPADRWKGRSTTLGLVAVPFSDSDPTPMLKYLCLATKGKRFTDRFAKVTFSRISEFAPLEAKVLEAALPSQFRPPFAFSVGAFGKPIPEKTWEHVRTVLINLRPDTEESLRALEAFVSATSDINEQRRQILQQEKDATGLALTVAGIPRTLLRDWQPASYAPFLNGITPGLAREDVLVIHDASRAPGWVPVDEPYVGVTQFSNQSGKSLTVMNVNRHEIEEITGVDLLYYRHEPDSFALVQYKRMQQTSSRGGDDDGPSLGSLGFRPASDGSIDSELKRMREVEALAENEHQPGPSSRDPILEYRLHPRACWLKLCHPEAFKPSDSDLVAGMYLPLDYWDHLISSDSTRGRRGGRVIGYDTVDRWLNNTLFVQLMSEGWIGSRTVQTAWLTDTVQAALSAKRSVVIAEEDSRPRSRYRRR